ncbi:MAG: nitrous oxide-stimulated promoter family protein [Coriobacteriales bacterium]|nr:nitrous oxide-stimulated promoter family protein [Actinomycetes bacterium]
MGTHEISERFAERMGDRSVAHDIRTVGDFIGIYCAAHHRDRTRSQAITDAARLGVYGDKAPVVCDECAQHLAYAEKRRAYCRKDPKPFCAHCDTHCYSPAESAWQRQMMRFSGPRAVFHGHALDGLRHAVEAITYTKKARKAAASGSTHEE